MRWPYYLGHVYMAKAEPAKAIASFERALRLQPADVATLVWLGNVHLDQGQPELAEPLFTRALSRTAPVVSALFGLGRAALAKREYSAGGRSASSRCYRPIRARRSPTIRSRLRIGGWATRQRPKRTCVSRAASRLVRRIR